MANGQLSDPITLASSSTLSKDSAVPYDDREQEVLYAGLVAAISTTWISFEVSVRHVLSSLLLFFSSTLLLFFFSFLLLKDVRCKMNAEEDDEKYLQLRSACFDIFHFVKDENSLRSVS